MTITKIMQDAITALLKLNNNQDRILVLYEAMRHEEERFQECASCGGRAQPVAAFRSYKCMSCGGVFQSDWSDEDANAEFKAKHGTDPPPVMSAMSAGGATDASAKR